MERYCTNCNKSFDFKIKSMTDLDSLICPECGAKIDKNSRKPVEEDNMDAKLGSVFHKVFHFLYIFYMLCAVVGIIAFFLNLSKLLFVVTAISLVVFVFQLLSGYNTFRSGLVFLPIGALVGYLKFGTYEGACLGVMIVFAIRHVVRDIIFRLIMGAAGQKLTAGACG